MLYNSSIIITLKETCYLCTLKSNWKKNLIPLPDKGWKKDHFWSIVGDLGALINLKEKHNGVWCKMPNMQLTLMLIARIWKGNLMESYGEHTRKCQSS